MRTCTYGAVQVQNLTSPSTEIIMNIKWNEKQKNKEKEKNGGFESESKRFQCWSDTLFTMVIVESQFSYVKILLTASFRKAKSRSKSTIKSSKDTKLPSVGVLLSIILHVSTKANFSRLSRYGAVQSCPNFERFTGVTFMRISKPTHMKFESWFPFDIAMVITTCSIQRIDCCRIIDTRLHVWL